MKTINLKEELPNEVKEENQMDKIHSFLKSEHGKPYSLKQLCVKFGFVSGGGLSSRIKYYVSIGKVKEIRCPCGVCMMYYVGKTPKFI